MNRNEIDASYQKLWDELSTALTKKVDLAVVQAPPGSGKTHTLIEVVSRLVQKGFSVALAAQTNRQADDIAKRWHESHPKLLVIRLGGSKSQPPRDFPSSIRWETKAKELPRNPGVYISTSAKWSTMRNPDPFDLLAVDEAWQMSWANLMKCANLSKKFFLIGDPGQIPPVVTIDVRRWQTSPRGPHLPAPEVVLADDELKSKAFIGSLPACRRLPNESVRFVKPFYAFDFYSYAQPKEREITFKGKSLLLEKMQSGEPVVFTIKSADEGALVEVDNQISKKIREIVHELMSSAVKIIVDENTNSRFLEARDIGVCATHRSMNGDISQELGPDFQDVIVDTPERWQGLQRPIMIVVHPLSNVMDPSEFDLETGRLCVMASRHQVGLIILTRDHVGETLKRFIPSAGQAPGAPDTVGRGHHAHKSFWTELERAGRITALS